LWCSRPACSWQSPSRLCTGSVTPRSRRWLLWTPRAILLLFVVGLALLSLDVIESGRSASEIGVGLLLHNLPTIGLLVIALAAWRWLWVGALGLVAFAGWWLMAFAGSGFPPSMGHSRSWRSRRPRPAAPLPRRPAAPWGSGRSGIAPTSG